MFQSLFKKVATFLEEPKFNLKKWVFLFLTCLFLSFLFRSYSLYSEIIQIDEADFAAQGYKMAQGAIPYVDFVEKKPILSYLFYASIFNFFGWDMDYVHLVLIFWISLTSVFLFAIAKVAGHSKEGCLLALGYVIYSTCLPTNTALAAKTEYMLNLPSAISVLFFFIILKRGDKFFFNAYFCGFFLGVASLFKHQGGVLLLAFFLYLFFIRRKQVRFFLNFLALIIITIGFLTPWIFCVLVYSHLGFLHQFIEWNFSNNFKYVNSNFMPLLSLRRFFEGLGTFFFSVLPIFVCLYLTVKKTKYKDWLIFMFFWLLTGCLALSIGGRFSNHYFIQIFPPFIALAVPGFLYLMTAVNVKKGFKNFIFVLLILMPLGWNIFHWVSHYTKVYEPQFPVVSRVSDHLKKISDKGDKIFIWGYFSYPYYLAQREPASRFIICEYLVPYWEKKYLKDPHFDFNELNEWHKKNLDLLLEDLEKNKPKYIIDTSTGDFFKYWKIYSFEKFPPLYRYVDLNYYLSDKVDGVSIYKRKNEVF